MIFGFSVLVLPGACRLPAGHVRNTRRQRALPWLWFAGALWLSNQAIFFIPFFILLFPYEPCRGRAGSRSGAYGQPRTLSSPLLVFSCRTRPAGGPKSRQGMCGHLTTLSSFSLLDFCFFRMSLAGGVPAPGRACADSLLPPVTKTHLSAHTHFTLAISGIQYF